MKELNAAQEILLAASALYEEGKEEFSEWDLTVRVWLLNKNRFGCRGYEQAYPDHKRVMMELMGKDSVPKQQGWIERTRRNYYRMTPLGLARAAELTGGERSTHRRAVELCRSVSRYVHHPVFRAHLRDREEPKTWLGAAAFLALPSNDPDALDGRLRQIEGGISGALEWIAETGIQELREGDAGTAVSRDDLLQLRAFLSLLLDRFEPQFEAIRSRGRRA
jgi:hypothetical protein